MLYSQPKDIISLPFPMADSNIFSFPPPAKNSPIISPHFCAPYSINLLITRKVKDMQHGDFVVIDMNGNIIFKLKDSRHSLYSTRVLLDAAENPIITLKPKHFSMHNRWQVFKGESTESSDMLFTAKRSSISMFQWKTKLDIFLANNSEQKVCDFKVKGSWSDTPCVFYTGESSSVIAQMHKKMEVESVLKGKKTVMVTVFPNQDYGFIVALIVILTAIKHSQDDGDAGGGDAGGGDAGDGGGGDDGGGCGSGGGCGGGGGD